jgi:hypothetical protein
MALKILESPDLEMARKGIAEFYVRPVEQVELLPEGERYVVKLTNAQGIVKLLSAPNDPHVRKTGSKRRPYVFGTF